MTACRCPCDGRDPEAAVRHKPGRLTAAGRAAFNQAHPDLLATEAALLSGLTPRDRTALASLLARLAASLEQEQDIP